LRTSRGRRIVGAGAAALLAAALGFAIPAMSAAATAPPGPSCVCNVTLSVSSGHRGITVTVRGSGFTPNRTTSIAFFGAYGKKTVLAASVPIDATGAFSRMVKIPRAAGAGHGRIHATNGLRGGAAGFFVTVNCPTDAGVSHAPSGAPGSDVTVRGGGFCAGTQVFIRFAGPGGRLTLLASAVRVGSDRHFIVTVTIPGGTKPGDAKIRVTDPSSSQKSATPFKVLANP
jgi:hypothetical protein